MRLRVAWPAGGRWILHARRCYSAPSLYFDAGTAVVPHPEKRSKGGEDAVWLATDGCAFGVFDGVGGWAEHGVDPALYSRSLALECDLAYEEHSIQDPVGLLHRAWMRSGSVMGSSTACVGVLVNDVLTTATLGDSAFLFLRGDQLLYRQQEQQHYFNCPYQLGTGSEDMAADADIWTSQVERGDVIVMATDGVLDNMFDADIVKFVQMGGTPQDIAESMAKSAASTAQSTTERTPFGVNAELYNAGFFKGGKLDDITVIVGRCELRQ